MRTLQLAAPTLLMIAVVGCAGPSPAPMVPTALSPTSGSPAPVAESSSPLPPTIAGPCVIGFDELKTDNAVFTTSTACGLAVTATAGSWQVWTNYGNPAPFIQFRSAAGTTAMGEINVAAAGATFSFVSVDIYSSTTKIPYEITGSAKGIEVFKLSDIQGNTFGHFATINNTRPTASIDALRIRLTNPSAPCCANPMGLDNIRVVR